MTAHSGGISMKRLFLGAVVASALMLAGPVVAPAFAQEKLTIWWSKGFYKSEDDALFEAIKKFEAKTGVKVDLSQYSPQDMVPNTVAGLIARGAPEPAYANASHFP